MRSALFIILLATLACTPGGKGEAGNTSSADQAVLTPKQEQDTLWKNLMLAHDEVMPEMNTIYQLASRIKEKLENSALDTAERDKLTSILEDLERSGDGMMKWMNELNVLPELRSDSLTHEEIMASLRKDEAKVIAVSQAMRQSIAEAEAALGSTDE